MKNERKNWGKDSAEADEIAGLLETLDSVELVEKIEELRKAYRGENAINVAEAERKLADSIQSPGQLFALISFCNAEKTGIGRILLSKIKYLLAGGKDLEEKKKILGYLDRIADGPFNFEQRRMVYQEYSSLFNHHLDFDRHLSSAMSTPEADEVSIFLSIINDSATVLGFFYAEKSAAIARLKVLFYLGAHLILKNKFREASREGRKYKPDKNDLAEVVRVYQDMLKKFAGLVGEGKIKLDNLNGDLRLNSQIPADEDVWAVYRRPAEFFAQMQLFIELRDCGNDPEKINILPKSDSLLRHKHTIAGSAVLGNAIMAMSEKSFINFLVDEDYRLLELLVMLRLGLSNLDNRQLNLLNLLKLEAYRKNEAGRPVYEEHYQRLLKLDGFLEDLMEDRLASVDESKWDKIRALFLAPEFFDKNRDRFAKLLRLTLKGTSLHFYQCCRLLAKMLEGDNQALREYIIDNLFYSGEALIDPVRSAIYRNLLELLPMEKRAPFMQRLLKGRTLSVGLATDGDRIANVMKQYNQYLEKAEDSAKIDAGMELPEIVLPERQNAQLLGSILASKSIHLSSDGHRLGKTGIDSELEEIFVETKITPNKDTRKYPKSLACHINLRRADGSITYLKVSLENDLLMRRFINGQFVEDVKVNGLDEKSNASELWYFILRKLEHLYVRKAADNDSTNPLARPANDHGSAAPEDHSTTDNDVQPLAQVRTETEHVIDLTESQRGTEMGAEDLSANQVEDRKLQKEMSRNMRANRQLAVKLLERLAAAEDLPEKLPEDLENLVIYERIEIEGDTFFEVVPIASFYLKLRKKVVDLNNYYIRSKRAHTSTLPYIKFEDEETGLSRIVQKKAQLEKVEMKKTLFMESGEGHGLDLAKKDKILSFEVEATDANLRLFEALSRRTAAQIEAVIGRRINRALDRNIELARRKYAGSDGQPNESFLRIEERMKKLAGVLQEMEVKLEMELLGKFIKLEKPVSPLDTADQVRQKMVLRLPQIFSFEQTFNQGQFESLEALQQKLSGKKESIAAE